MVKLLGNAGDIAVEGGHGKVPSEYPLSFSLTGSQLCLGSNGPVLNTLTFLDHLAARSDHVTQFWAISQKQSFGRICHFNIKKKKKKSRNFSICPLPHPPFFVPRLWVQCLETKQPFCSCEDKRHTVRMGGKGDGWIL